MLLHIINSLLFFFLLSDVQLRIYHNLLPSECIDELSVCSAFMLIKYNHFLFPILREVSWNLCCKLPLGRISFVANCALNNEILNLLIADVVSNTRAHNHEAGLWKFHTAEAGKPYNSA